MNNVKKFVKACWYFFWGHILGYIYYDKKYLTGRWFRGKCKGINAQGWKWVTLDIFSRRGIGGNPNAKYPISPLCHVVNPENIEFHPDDLNNFQSFGIYYQAIGRIEIGKGTYIGPNVGLITANHDYADLDRHLQPEDIVLGCKCWIGMNSVILPGVTLGDNTVVGAGSVVTKSFVFGNCVIAGNPAKVIKYLNNDNKDN